MVTAIIRGWPMMPTIKSAVAKHASAILDLRCSRFLVATAAITSRFNRMVKGKVVALIIMVKTTTV